MNALRFLNSRLLLVAGELIKDAVEATPKKDPKLFGHLQK